MHRVLTLCWEWLLSMLFRWGFFFGSFASIRGEHDGSDVEEILDLVVGQGCWVLLAEGRSLSLCKGLPAAATTSRTVGKRCSLCPCQRKHGCCLVLNERTWMQWSLICSSSSTAETRRIKWLTTRPKDAATILLARSFGVSS